VPVDFYFYALAKITLLKAMFLLDIMHRIIYLSQNIHNFTACVLCVVQHVRQRIINHLSLLKAGWLTFLVSQFS